MTTVEIYEYSRGHNRKFSDYWRFAWIAAAVLAFLVQLSLYLSEEATLDSRIVSAANANDDDVLLTPYPLVKTLPNVRLSSGSKVQFKDFALQSSRFSFTSKADCRTFVSAGVCLKRPGASLKSSRLSLSVFADGGSTGSVDNIGSRNTNFNVLAVISGELGEVRLSTSNVSREIFPFHDLCHNQSHALVSFVWEFDGCSLSVVDYIDRSISTLQSQGQCARVGGFDVARQLYDNEVPFATQIQLVEGVLSLTNIDIANANLCEPPDNALFLQKFESRKTLLQSVALSLPVSSLLFSVGIAVGAAAHRVWFRLPEPPEAPSYGRDHVPTSRTSIASMAPLNRHDGAGSQESSSRL